MLVRGVVGVGVGVHSGASGLGLSSSSSHDLIYWLTVPGSVAGGFAGLLLRRRLSLAGVLWLIRGELLGLGRAALVGGICWEWLDTPPALVLGLGAGGGVLGALVGPGSPRAGA